MIEFVWFVIMSAQSGHLLGLGGGVSTVERSADLFQVLSPGALLNFLFHAVKLARP